MDTHSLQQLLAYRELNDLERQTEREHFFQRHFHTSFPGGLFLPLRMNASYLDQQKLEEHGGWLKRDEYEQAHLFMHNLITSLGASDEQVVLYMTTPIAGVYGITASDFSNLHVVDVPFLEPQEHVTLSPIADLNIDRAMRCVTEAEIAATGSHTVITPCPTGYMHEDVATADAERQGLVKHIPITTPNLGEAILDYVGSPHYHHSRIRRMSAWDHMLADKNIMERLLQIHASKSIRVQ